MIEVTESDRRAVRAFQKASVRYMHRIITDVSFGSALGEQQDDTHPIYQAFATHRIEAAKAERDRLQPKIEALEAALQEQTARADKHWRTVNDKQYMIEALVPMLGPTALTVWRGWLKKGIQRVHYSWGPDAANLSGEDRAKIMLEWDNAPRTLVSNVDAALESKP